MTEPQQSNEAVATRSFTTHEDEWRALVLHMQATFDARLAADGNGLFHVKTQMGNTGVVEAMMVSAGLDSSKLDLPVHLNQVYLGSLTDERQYHTCSCCSNFLTRFGDLVTIDADGQLHSALWDASTFPEDNFYHPVLKNLQAVVERGSITGPHYQEGEVWGEQVAGGFDHFFVKPPVHIQHMERDVTGRQKQAIRRERRNRLAETFGTDPMFMPKYIDQLKQILDSDAIKGVEKIMGPGTWLIETLNNHRSVADRTIKNNLFWRAIGPAPDGFLYPASTMTGTVLEDLQKGKSLAQIIAAYGRKTAAHVYQRPVEAPTDGAIEAAEKLVSENGLRPSFARRVMYLEDIPDLAKVWSQGPGLPKAKEEEGSLFGHLKSSAETIKALEFPPVEMSWNKFVADVLPDAQKIEILVLPREFVQAWAIGTNPEAPPIFSYDLPEARNTASTFTRFIKRNDGFGLADAQPQPIDAADWNLKAGEFVNVPTIIHHASEWSTGRAAPNTKERLDFVLEGGYDKTAEAGNPGVAIFPETLRSDLHSIKRVVEAYSNTAYFTGDFPRQVTSMAIYKGGRVLNRVVRVTSNTGTVRKIELVMWE